MLCLPAFTPVANDAHAVGDSGECVVCSGEKPPCLASAAMCGSLPSPIHFSSRCGSMPSKPRITSFWLNFDGPRRDGPEQARESAATTTRAARTRTDVLIGASKLYARAESRPPCALTEGGQREEDRRIRHVHR